MSDFVSVFDTENYVELMLLAGNPEVLSVGERMNAACPDAYMNGYNWEAFFNWYLEKNAPDILEGMKTDPEADTYVAYWPLSPENKSRAKRFGQIVRSLMEDAETLCRLVRDEGGSIQWD